MKNIIILLRPHQWLKNIFIFLPLFFGRHLMDMHYWAPCLLTFLAYSLAAGGIYCFNDIHDAEADRRHPRKCSRPIAAGTVSKTTGYAVMAAVIACSYLLVFLGDFTPGGSKPALCGLITFYLLMNVAYCVILKQKAIIDVFTIATGFVLRVLAGGIATGIRLSEWIILMTFLLALFLAFAKRRDDVVMYEETGVKVRKNVNRYNLAFMNQATGVVASITMICYIMYTVSPEVTERFGSRHIYLTSVFVLAGIIRYLQVAIVDVRSGSPTKVLMKDRFIQACIAGWTAAFGMIVYL